MNIDQLLITLVPVLVSGIVAIVTSKELQALKEIIAENQVRIAVLETLLRDHDIPVPTIRKDANRTSVLRKGL